MRAIDPAGNVSAQEVECAATLSEECSRQAPLAPLECVAAAPPDGAATAPDAGAATAPDATPGEPGASDPGAPAASGCTLGPKTASSDGATVLLLLALATLARSRRPRS
jgi:hypothetical protein